MKIKKTVLLPVAAVLSALALQPAYSANLVANGDFETTTGYGQLSGANYTGVTASSWTNTAFNAGWATLPAYNFMFNATTAASGVTGSEGPVALYGPVTASPNGGNFMGLDGAYHTGPITQTINGMTAGSNYTLSFYWAAAQQSGYVGDTTDKITVSLGGQSYDTGVVNLTSGTFGVWKKETFSFTASAASAVLSFLATGTPTGLPPFALIDGVTLDSPSTPPTPTPLPAALPFMVSGLAGLFGISRLGRRKKA